MIPASVTAVHVRDAARTIDRDGVPKGRESRGYDMVLNGRMYPPKYVVALAAKAATGRLPTSEDFGGGDETNAFLRKLGFVVIARGEGVPAAFPSGVRIGVVSFRWGTAASEAAALADAFAAVRSGWDGAVIALLPGFGKHWHKDTKRLGKLATASRLNVLFEAWKTEDMRYFALDERGQLSCSAEKQVFGTSREANSDPAVVERLLAESEPGGARRFKLAGVDIGLLICGENNVLTNEQAKANRCAGVRGHPKRALFKDAAVVHNGAHTLMGNWSKLNARFEWLSRGGRVATYATNNDKPGGWVRALRVYHDGNKVADGEEGGVVAGVTVDVVRDPKDQFRALTTTVP